MTWDSIMLVICQRLLHFSNLANQCAMIYRKRKVGFMLTSFNKRNVRCKTTNQNNLYLKNVQLSVATSFLFFPEFVLRSTLSWTTSILFLLWNHFLPASEIEGCGSQILNSPCFQWSTTVPQWTSHCKKHRQMSNLFLLEIQRAFEFEGFN